MQRGAHENAATPGLDRRSTPRPATLGAEGGRMPKPFSNEEGHPGATTKRLPLFPLLKKLEHGDTPISKRAHAALKAEQVDRARKLIDKGEARQYVADLLNVGRSTPDFCRLLNAALVCGGYHVVAGCSDQSTTGIPSQFGEGFSAESITRNSTGPLADFTSMPNCSRSAVNSPGRSAPLASGSSVPSGLAA